MITRLDDYLECKIVKVLFHVKQRCKKREVKSFKILQSCYSNSQIGFFNTYPVKVFGANHRNNHAQASWILLKYLIWNTKKRIKNLIYVFASDKPIIKENLALMGQIGCAE